MCPPDERQLELDLGLPPAPVPGAPRPAPPPPAPREPAAAAPLRSAPELGAEIIRTGPDWLRHPAVRALREAKGTAEVGVEPTGRRESFSGRAYSQANLIRMVSEGVHPIPWLLTFLHELAHISDWRQRRRALEADLGRPLRRSDLRTLWNLDRSHGKLWRAQFIDLVEAAVAHGLFPGNEALVRDHAASGAASSAHLPLDLTADPRVQAEDLRQHDERRRAAYEAARDRERRLREGLRVGQTVYFISRRQGAVLSGAVRRVNRLTATVDVAGEGWRVPLHLLHYEPPLAVPAPSRPRLRDRFQVGQLVAFRANGQRHEGRITRVNRKTCTVETATGPWRVPFGLLRTKEKQK